MSEQTHDPTAISEMGEEQCWELLARNEYGHLAYLLVKEPHIAPLNYVLAGGRLVFRTAEGEKLLGMTMSDSVAFEVDEIGDHHASSVILRGKARTLTGREADAAEELPLHPWVATMKFNVVAIEPTEVTGRVFRLSR